MLPINQAGSNPVGAGLDQTAKKSNNNNPTDQTYDRKVLNSIIAKNRSFLMPKTKHNKLQQTTVEVGALDDLKTNNGITLIAIVVTVIVLIILAAVTINLLLGQNGIITRARDAGKAYNAAAYKEEVEMDIQDVITGLIVDGETVTGPSDPDFIERMEDKGYTVTDNGDGTITLEKDGGTATVHPDWTVEVEGVPNQGSQVIDTNPPQVTVSYSTTAPTNGSVIVTMEIDKAITIPAGWTMEGTDQKKFTKEYTINVDETIEIQDLSGDTNNVTISINNIDTTNPNGIASYNPTTPTSGNVLVTITTNKEIQTPAGWVETSTTTYTKAYTENKTENITITDLASNTGSVEVAVTNIDKTIYDDGTGKIAYVPDKLTPSTTPGETTIDGGLVVKGPDNSEFVWVPVPNPVLDVQGKNDTQINAAIAAEVAAGRYPMAIKTSTTDYKGVLYDFSGTTTPATVTPRTYAANGTIWREPDVATGQDNTSSNYTNAGIAGITTSAQFKIQLQTEYNQMVTSVIDKGGFYIGRYETSLNGVNAQSKYNIVPANNINWYSLYQKQKLYTTNNSISNVTSGMIYGSQWDQVMIWMRNVKNPYVSNKPYIVDSTGMGNCIGTTGLDTWASGDSSAGTGCIKVNNIYDLAGNVFEWTQEVGTDYGRNSRGRVLLWFRWGQPTILLYT